MTDFWQIFTTFLVGHLGLGKGIFSGRRFLAGLGIFGMITDFWQLRVFGGVQRIFPTLGKFGRGGQKMSSLPKK